MKNNLMIPKKLKDLFFEEVTAYGGALLYIFTVILALITKNLDLILPLLAGLGLLYLSAIIIRIFYFKQRPEKRKYKTYIGKIDASSFPSLHSARALFFTFVMNDFFQNIYIFYFLIFLTIVVGYSRIYLNKHYLSDVFGGYIFGAIIYFIIIVIF